MKMDVEGMSTRELKQAVEQRRSRPRPSGIRSDRRARISLRI
ncbi:hypothetical protein HMPREF0322_03844 [Desulfitobacterium hafniense DP7]|uniref:Uncharacterized protein n=1 Tax=Desulfitobacterium hafniense DP7 TaxID=537010 RepID=G9XS95_DESHA|nr:hypothetical protein HMPREF0322_03844 [Desulfitobacterium hafniense DP7]